MTNPFPPDLKNMPNRDIQLFHTICFVGGGSVFNGGYPVLFLPLCPQPLTNLRFKCKKSHLLLIAFVNEKGDLLLHFFLYLCICVYNRHVRIVYH